MNKKKVVLGLVPLGVCLLTGLSVSAEDPIVGESEAKVEFEAGSLELTQVPDFDFGSIQISLEEQTVYAHKKVSGTDPFAVVTDLRGNGVGWSLSVKYDGAGFVNEGKILPALLSINGQRPENVGGTVVTQGDPIIISENDQVFWDAPSPTGMGKNTIFLGHDSSGDKTNEVELTIPANTRIFVGQYTMTLQWTLSQSPTSEVA